MSWGGSGVDVTAKGPGGRKVEELRRVLACPKVSTEHEDMLRTKIKKTGRILKSLMGIGYGLTVKDIHPANFTRFLRLAS
jgi:hypothetical protein